MWFKTNIIILIYLITSLNGKEMINDNMENEREENFNMKNLLKIKRNVNEISMDGIHDDDADNDNDNDNNHRILNEQLKWFTIYNELDKFNRIAMLIRENDQFNPLLIPAPTKKASTSRLCGTKLVDAIIKLCNGCVKPVGGKAVSVKRCKFFFFFSFYLSSFSFFLIILQINN